MSEWVSEWGKGKVVWRATEQGETGTLHDVDAVFVREARKNNVVFMASWGTPDGYYSTFACALTVSFTYCIPDHLWADGESALQASYASSCFRYLYPRNGDVWWTDRPARHRQDIMANILYSCCEPLLLTYAHIVPSCAYTSAARRQRYLLWRHWVHHLVSKQIFTASYVWHCFCTSLLYVETITFAIQPKCPMPILREH